MKKTQISIGTRGSDLALWQAHFVKSELEKLNVICNLVVIKTQGDTLQHLTLDKLEGKGFFTKEIEEALLAGQIDLAVHSHKDLETEQPKGLVVAAVSDRADPSEYLLIRNECVDSNEKYCLKKNAIVGTSSARRKAQMNSYRPDIILANIRGNVPTRIQKLRDKHFDAILLAKAGVDRLQLDISDLKATILSVYDFIPAPAQGVLAIQCRSDDSALIALLSALNNESIQQNIYVERSVLHRLHGGCHLPLGVFVEKSGDFFEAHVAIAKDERSPLSKFAMHHTDPNILIENILLEINK